MAESVTTLTDRWIGATSADGSEVYAHSEDEAIELFKDRHLQEVVNKLRFKAWEDENEEYSYRGHPDD